MADTNKEAIDYAKIAAELNKLAETPNAKAWTLADHLREVSIYNSITKAKAQGYKAEAIVEILGRFGIKTTAASFDQTWRKIMREERGETGVKDNAKPKANAKKSAAAKPSEAGAEKPSETKPDSSGDKPAATGTKPDDKPEGKTLTKQPNMGGAFGNDL